MSEELVNALARFHQQVVLPDIQRVVGTAVEEMGRQLRDEMHTLHDSVLAKLERLETEYHSIKVGLGRVEERLDRVEQRLDGVEQRLDGVEQRLGTLEADHRDLVATVRKLDERLSRVEKRLDELIVAQRDYASRAEVQELRTRLDGLQTRIDTLEKRLQ
jgi:chromosome segregation ATPase